ncbi:rhodanese-like domain-containing protein [Blastococcus sp. TBT05-19]|uniref:rhodanese-like domain-containing protein n=1 Tax=Blastococcus sp. TBT05-19 TaxID=2250581 RepID=UPI000DE9F719|nr:rhodanese-like domain-containing protein [Blastococcus sp. TBT05-19]RBY94920.1 rhodanese-like domain-containing protein [Blastococcus sp. TBT05-19]
MPRLRRTTLALLATALLAGGCAGDPRSTEAAPSSAGPATLLDPAAFADVIAGDEAFVVNVHVPDEGSIEGTDAAIPFDRIEQQQAQLPADRSTPLALYCRSGNMSADAAVTLAELGYTDVVDLEGGMVAWEADGRPLLPPGA